MELSPLLNDAHGSHLMPPSSEDALGEVASPLFLPHAVEHTDPLPSIASPSASEQSAHLSADLNLLAKQRFKEDDSERGIKFRKTSKNPRSRARPSGEARPKRKTAIRRPREPRYPCVHPGCNEKFTQKRKFEMHCRTHGKPLFVCNCGKALTRDDNFQVHLRSPIHRRKMAKLLATQSQTPSPLITTLDPLAASTSTSSPSSSTSPCLDFGLVFYPYTHLETNK